MVIEVQRMGLDPELVYLDDLIRSVTEVRQGECNMDLVKKAALLQKAFYDLKQGRVRKVEVLGATFKVID